MDFSAAHSGFVIVSYGLVALALFGLIGFVFWRDRKLVIQLQRLNESAKT